MSKTKTNYDEIIDATNLKVCQLNKPNENFLEERDFVDEDGSYRRIRAKILKVTREWLQIPGSSNKNLVNCFSFHDRKKRWATTAKINNAGLKSWFGTEVKNCKGKEIVLFYDPKVECYGKVVGGIRIVHKESERK